MNGLTFKKLAANCTLIAACLTLAASPLMAANLATGFSGSAVPNSTVRFTGSLTDASGKTSSINVSTKASATGNYTLSSPVTNGADSMTGKIVYDTKIGSATQTNTLNFEWDRYTSSIRFYGTISPYGSVNLTTSGGEGTGAPIVAGAGGAFDTGDIVSTGFISGSTNVGLSITNTQYNCSPCVYTPASTTNLSYFVGLQSTGGSTGTGSANSGGGSGSGLGGTLTNVAIGAAVAGLSSLLGGNNSKSNVAAVQDNSIDPLRAMTEEITNVMVDQSHIKAEAADADAQKDVALVTGEQTAELAIELTPSEAECDITSLHAASAPTLIHNSQAQANAGATTIGDYAIGAAGTTGALSAPERISFVADLVRASCNPGDMGGMLTDFCEQTQIQLSPTALYGAQGPLDVDLKQGTGSQFEQVSALIDIMIEPLTLPTSDQLKRSRAERRRMGSEGTWLMNHKQDIASALSQIMGSNIGTANENETEMRALLEEMGLSQSQQDAFFTPDGKISEDAQLEILTHYYFLSPKFLGNIQNSEAALSRIQGSLDAADQMLNTKIQEMMALKNRQITMFNAIDIRNESNERNRALTTVSNN